jgi:hypothetical protein
MVFWIPFPCQAELFSDPWAHEVNSGSVFHLLIQSVETAAVDILANVTEQVGRKSFLSWLGEANVA